METKVDASTSSVAKLYAMQPMRSRALEDFARGTRLGQGERTPIGAGGRTFLLRFIVNCDAIMRAPGRKQAVQRSKRNTLGLRIFDPGMAMGYKKPGRYLSSLRS